MSLGMSPVTVAGTVGCAFAIGFVMQNVQTDVPDPQSRTLRVAHVEQSMLAPVPGPASRKTTRHQIDNLPAMPQEPTSPGVACPIELSAEPQQSAYLHLSLNAPCRQNSAVEFHHAGMIVSARTDAKGQVALSLPALLANAVVIASFEDGSGTVGMARVADLDQIERVVVQWAGDAGLNLHVREFGAEYGQSGHLWTGAEPGRAGLGRISRHGNTALPASNTAEVYTFPKASSGSGGTVAITIEAEVTLDNCGRDVPAQSLELRGDGRLRSRDLELAMPDCGAVGSFLVLNNLMEDLKIASR